jgi:DNA processing protein
MEKRIYKNLKSESHLIEDEIILDRIQKSNFAFKKLEIVGGVINTNKPFVGVVGARFPTNYGRHVATMIVRDLAEAGAVIVSGLMYGIDLIAHNTALNCGGNTIGVLGYGFDSLPKMSFAKRTYEQILNSKNSFLISQFESDYPPSKWTYPNRNMLIAALSDVLIVVEAGLKSGSLITANFMLDLNKE